MPRCSAEQALRHAKRLEAIGQLTGGVAHDFNNLLMVVTGNIDRMRRDLGETRFKRQLDMIEAAAQRGQNLTRQLLSFSRRQNLQPTVFDIVERVQALDPMLRSSLRGDIELVIDVPQEALAVRADSAELELAILNLAVNARDAMPGGGRLRVAVKPVVLHGEEEHDALSGEFVALTLADTGVGIAPEVRDRIFEPFFTTKDIDKGTGLGLSQVYGFVKQSGGTVTVESERGQGTSFTLYLPRASVSAVESKAAPRERPARRGRGSILLVEDNAQVAEVATGLLEELGYGVTAVTGAQAALDRLAQGGEFDLVFSDIVMPGGMSGVQLAQTIAQRRPGLPVVLTTGYHDSLQGKAPAGVPILQKPYDSADLDRAMRAALARRAA
jgi:two-component system NtrC family sensor kinase